MKAVIMGRNKGGAVSASVEEVDEPTIAEGDILVKMLACGLCGTDIEKIRGEYTAAMPVLGHEAVGEVAESGARGFKKGERVFPHHHVPCGECRLCRSGAPTMCERYRTSNLSPGGFSEKFQVPRWNVEKGGVLRLPESVSSERAALIEPLACCIRAIDRLGVVEGDSALVVGAGPVGLMHAIYLQSLGVQPILTDVSQARVDFATGLGFDALRADKVNVGVESRKRTGGAGVDEVIVASGSPKAIVQGLQSVRKGGMVSLFGIPTKGVHLDYPVADIYLSEVSLIPSYGATEVETPRALKALLADGKKYEKLITHRFAIHDFDEAVKAAESGSAMKVLILPQT
ncbi:MAG TPA: alcohol dehydrogenase catalytic domain-containing protein [Nitrososphaerales archaeon]|nr:alcohol dehydrogenase catalytic domain-containing protein [Nitrososphaerales archaeon]